MKPTFGSLFAGIGGFDRGLELAGWECKWQVEIDDFCQKVLHKHWPNVPKYRDIYEVDFTQVEPVDMVCGGFPCQPFSQVGLGRGEEDERYLWPELARAVGEVKPGWVLLENVPRLLGYPRTFGAILRDLAALGFDAEWDRLPAAAFGAPHLRYRLFLVAHAKGLGRRKGRKGGSVGQHKGVQNAKGALAHPHSKQIFGPPEPWKECAPWEPEPPVGRVVDGVPHRLVAPHLSGLGNAVVPQVAEWIGRRMIEAMQ